VVALNNQEIPVANVRLTRPEAILLVTAVTIGVVNGDEPPECCKSSIEEVVNRVLNAFDMTFEIDEESGDMRIDGMVIARLEDE
jgi:hypothetical protein